MPHKKRTSQPSEHKSVSGQANIPKMIQKYSIFNTKKLPETTLADKDSIEKLFKKGIDIAYSKGNDLSNEDAKKAIIEFNKVIERETDPNGPYTQFILGFKCEYGIDCKKDNSLAFNHYKNSASQGNEDAMTNLALCYSSGKGVATDIELAVQHLRIAIAHNPRAQHYLAWHHVTGNGCIKDQKKAFEGFKIAAIQNFALAQFYLGLCYEDGIGVDKDEALAAHWFQKAADKGHICAQNQLQKMSGKTSKKPEI